jgi:YD repeat-containing protein
MLRKCGTTQSVAGLDGGWTWTTLLSVFLHRVESLDIGFGSLSWPHFLSAISREDRMQTMQTAGAISTYSYDGDGLRRRIQDASGTITIVWDGTDYLQERT